jgi:hypothetical protein
MQTDNLSFLGDRLLEILLSLIAFQMLSAFFPVMIAMIFPKDQTVFYYANANWLNNLPFGVAVYFFLRRQKVRSIPIVILSMLTPLSGSLFYLLALVAQNKTE